MDLVAYCTSTGDVVLHLTLLLACHEQHHRKSIKSFYMLWVLFCSDTC